MSLHGQFCGVPSWIVNHDDSQGVLTKHEGFHHRIIMYSQNFMLPRASDHDSVSLLFVGECSDFLHTINSSSSFTGEEDEKYSMWISTAVTIPLNAAHVDYEALSAIIPRHGFYVPIGRHITMSCLNPTDEISRAQEVHISLCHYPSNASDLCRIPKRCAVHFRSLWIAEGAYLTLPDSSHSCEMRDVVYLRVTKIVREQNTQKCLYKQFEQNSQTVFESGRNFDLRAEHLTKVLDSTRFIVDFQLLENENRPQNQNPDTTELLILSLRSQSYSSCGPVLLSGPSCSGKFDVVRHVAYHMEGYLFVSTTGMDFKDWVCADLHHVVARRMFYREKRSDSSSERFPACVLVYIPHSELLGMSNKDENVPIVLLKLRSTMRKHISSQDGGIPLYFVLGSEKVEELHISVFEMCWTHVVTSSETLKETSNAVACTTPSKNWDTINGLKHAKVALQRAVIWPITHRKYLQRFKLDYSRGVLLHGSPGCGKTSLVRTLTQQHGVSMIHIDSASVFSSYVGASEAFLRNIFRKARQQIPCVVFFDEVEAIARKRSDDRNGPEISLLATLLTEMDGISSTPGVIFIGATNLPDVLDPAMCRPGRFDLMLEIPLPDMSTRREIIEKKLNDEYDIDLESFKGSFTSMNELRKHLAERTEGHSCADVEAICSTIVRRGLERYISKHCSNIQEIKSIEITYPIVLIDSDVWDAVADVLSFVV